jgi:DNA-binding IclR family transcriptional regulator
MMLGISKNSTFRIAMTLLSFQYINRDERSKQFSLSGKLLWLGYSAVNEQNLVEKSFDIMHDLRDAVRETVLIGVLLGNQGIVLEQVPGTYSIKFLVDPGAHFPLHTAAPSKAILAFTPEPGQKKIVDTIDFKAFNKKTITSKSKFYEILSNTRSMGYGIDLGEEIEGIHCVAAPIFNRHGFPTAAIWTTGPAERMPENKIHNIAKKVSQHAKTISQRLGYFKDGQ